jgi:hypothetical protein
LGHGVFTFLGVVTMQSFPILCERFVSQPWLKKTLPPKLYARLSRWSQAQLREHLKWCARNSHSNPRLHAFYCSEEYSDHWRRIGRAL